MPRHIKPGPLLWLLLVALASGTVVARLHGGWLNTDLLDLLPHDRLPPAVSRISEQDQRHFARQTLWLIPGANAAEAASKTRALRARLDASGLFTETGPDLSADRLQQRYRALHPYRFELLSPADRRLLDHHPQALIDNALARLYGPFGVSGAQWRDDPLFLFEHYLESLAPIHLDVSDGIPVIRQGGRYWGLTVAPRAGHAFALNDQSRLLQLTDQLRARWPGMHLTGVPIYAAAGAASAHREISRVGTLSLLAVVLLFLALFLSLRPMLLALVSVATGVLCGLAATLAVFGQLNLLTLVFGASLIGVAVDYSLHFFCHRFDDPTQTPGRLRRRLLAPLSLALASSVLGYLAMALASFPGLRQVAVFSAAGLIGAWLTVLLVIPAATGSRPPPPRPRLLAAVARWRRGWPGYCRRHPWLSALATLLIMGGILRLSPMDDVRQYQSPPAWLQAQTRAVRGILPAGDSQTFIVHGADRQQWWRREHALGQALHAQEKAGHLGSTRLISDGWPLPEAQRTTYQALGKSIYHAPRFRDYLQRVGLNKGAINDRIAAYDRGDRPLNLKTWLNALDDDSLSRQWGGCDTHGCTSLVRLGGIHDLPALAALAAPDQGVWFVDRAARISATLGVLRVHLGLLLLAAYLLSGLVLALARGPRAALRLLGVPALASLLTLGALGWLSGEYGLITVLALYLVLGIGIDYAIFFEQERTGTHGGAALGVLLSAATTGLSFGLLALSETRLVHDFGLTLLIGILGAALIAPIAAFPVSRTPESDPP